MCVHPGVSPDSTPLNNLVSCFAKSTCSDVTALRSSVHRSHSCQSVLLARVLGEPTTIKPLLISTAMAHICMDFVAATSWARTAFVSLYVIAASKVWHVHVHGDLIWTEEELACAAV